MMNSVKGLLAGAAALAMAGVTPVAANAAVVYQSVPDLFASPIANAWCSDCYGGTTFEPLDPFTLTQTIHVNGLELLTGPGSSYEGLSGFTLEIYNASHTSILFSQAITPTQLATNGDDDFLLGGAVSGLTLGPGNYWAGFIAPYMGVPGLPGGNGGLIDTDPPHTGDEYEFLGGNTAYAFLGTGVPEPGTWATMLLGLGGVGALLRARRRRNQVALVAA